MVTSAVTARSRKTVSVLLRRLNRLDANYRTGSKVKCSNCQEFGHTKVRCKQPPADQPDNDTGGGFDGNAGGDSGAGGGWNNGGDSGNGGDYGQQNFSSGGGDGW